MNRFWKGYIISSIIVFFGAFFLYAKENNPFTFNVGEFLMWIPFYLLVMLLISGGFVLLLKK